MREGIGRAKDYDDGHLGEDPGDCHPIKKTHQTSAAEYETIVQFQVGLYHPFQLPLRMILVRVVNNVRHVVPKRSVLPRFHG